jgi:hypothetical protein
LNYGGYWNFSHGRRLVNARVSGGGYEISAPSRRPLYPMLDGLSLISSIWIRILAL